MQPRAINPEGINDEEWWDIEALKLAVIRPFAFRAYVNVDQLNISGSGSTGLAALELLDSSRGELWGQTYDQRQIDKLGRLLIEACKRVSSTQKVNTDDSHGTIDE